MALYSLCSFLTVLLHLSKMMVTKITLLSTYVYRKLSVLENEVNGVISYNPREGLDYPESTLMK